jgi:hypothetical protein
MTSTSDRDEMRVADALRDDYESLCGEAHVPSAAVIWRRAAIRARAEAAQTVGRPIAAAQTFAAACLIALAAGAFASVRQSLPDVVVHHPIPLMLGVALCLLVVPVAVLIALAE